MNLFFLAMKLGWREWLAGKWYLFFVALTLAIAVFTGEYFFTDRFDKTLHQQAITLLGGDLVVSSPSPLPKKWIDTATNFALRSAEVWTFPTMAVYDNHFQLVFVQAVSEHYPLLGPKQNRNPKIGTLFADSRILNELGPLPKRLRIGNETFIVTHALDNDWENIFGLSFAPRVVMNLADVSKTQTIVQGSRVDYRLLLTGEPENIKKYRTWLAPQLTSGQIFIDLNNQRIPARDILTNANYYLSLAVIGCLLMTSAALIISANYYVEEQKSAVGLLRCLGLRRKELLFIFLVQLFMIALLATILGVFLGYGLHLLLLTILSKWVTLDLAPPSFLPAIMGFVIALILISVFALPSFLKLSRISAITIWRTEISKNLTFSFLNLVVLLGLMSFILYVLVHDFEFVFWIIFGVAMVIACTYLLLNLWFMFAKKWIEKLNGPLRRGFLNTLRFDNNLRLQTISFAIVIMAIVLLYNLRTDLLTNWQAQLPMDTPNYFVINLTPDQIEKFKTSLTEMKVQQYHLYPMVRGRLIGLNGKPILTVVPSSARNNNALNRELNLSWMSHLPPNNRIVSGQWWQTNDVKQNLISIEEGLANDLHIKLHDQLTFQIADREISGTVVNIRNLRWESFQPNFYIIFSPGVLDTFPNTYITSFYLPSPLKSQLNQLVQKFPNITIIDAANLLQQLIKIFNQASNALQYTFLLALIAGIIILWASMETTLASREENYRIMRILGASSDFIRKSLLIEFLVTGLLAGLMGTFIADLISFVIAYTFLNIDYHFSLHSWILGAGIGLIFVSIPGLWFLRHIVKIPPLLRE